MASTFFQKAGQNKHVFYNVNDRMPPLELQLIQSSDGAYYDISAGKGHIEIQAADGTYLVSGQSLNVASGATGTAHYYPAAGELSAAGTYNVAWKIDPQNISAYLTVPEYPYEYVLRID